MSTTLTNRMLTYLKPSKAKAKRAGTGQNGGPRGPAPRSHIFGVSLYECILRSNCPISYVDEDTGEVCYAIIPTLIAKCGQFLKDHGLEEKGIFRKAGSSKRADSLMEEFDRPPRYGATLDFQANGYDVHDVGTVLRRFLRMMPEPIVPLQHYDRFHDVIRANSEHTEESYIKTFQNLISSLPAANQFLLLYILDFLSVFASQSEATLMDVKNLAIVFTPSILFHPDHARDRLHYDVSHGIVEFLIEHDQFFKTPSKEQRLQLEAVLNYYRTQTSPGAPTPRKMTSPTEERPKRKIMTDDIVRRVSPQRIPDPWILSKSLEHSSEDADTPTGRAEREVAIAQSIIPDLQNTPEPSTMTAYPVSDKMADEDTAELQTPVPHARGPASIRSTTSQVSQDAPLNNYVLHGITIFIAAWFLVYVAQGQYFKGLLFAGSFVLLGYLMVQGMEPVEPGEGQTVDGTDSIPQSQSGESIQAGERRSSAGDSLRDEEGHIRQEFQSFLAKDYMHAPASGFQPQFSNLPGGDDSASVISNVSRFQERFASKSLESPEDDYDLFLDAQDLDYAIEHGISSLKR